jgi:hypothetical protein
MLANVAAPPSPHGAVVGEHCAPVPAIAQTVKLLVGKLAALAPDAKMSSSALAKDAATFR